MAHTEFLKDLAIIMMIAGLISLLFHRFKQPVVLGYLLAGMIVGPHTPPSPLVTDIATIQTLAELGVVFLLFSLGLEFSLKRLKAVGLTAVVAAVTEIVLMIWLGYQIGLAFGWSEMDALFLGAMLSISSTTIIVKALEAERKARREAEAKARKVEGGNHRDFRFFPCFFLRLPEIGQHDTLFGSSSFSSYF